MAYSIDPATGLPMLGRLALPLSPQQMGAAGQQQQTGGIPLPGPSPMGGMPANAVAGPGGGPTDLSSVPPMIPQYAPPPPVQRAAHEVTSDALHGMAGQLPAGGGPGGESAIAPPQLLPTMEGQATPSGAAPAPSGKDELGMTPEERRIYNDTLHNTGGPHGLRESARTEKYTQFGTVPQALTADIAERQASVAKGQAALDQATAAGKAQDLTRDADVIKQQQADAQAAADKQAAVQQRVDRLRATSDADQANLAQASPKGIADFWGGRALGSTASQMLAAVGTALGALGRNPNPGATIDQAIDRWQNNQRQIYEAAKDKATLSNNVYKTAIEQYGTPEAADAAVRAKALVAKNAMAQNLAAQSGNQLWLQNAQLMQQKDALQIQQLNRQALQTASAHEVESKLTQTGGGSASRELLALENVKKAHEYRKSINDSTIEDLKTPGEIARTEAEAEKLRAGAGSLATATTDAADAVQKLADATANFSGRVGAGGGDAEALKNIAENKLATALTKSGVSPRAALGQAQQMLAGSLDKGRLTGAAAAKLQRTINGLRGDAVRASARHAIGETAPDTGPEGESE